MSELKDRWFWAYPTESVDCDGITGSAHEVYSKSDVDKVIAELKAQKAQVEDDCAYWKMREGNAANAMHETEEYAMQLYNELRHSKYKRCLAMSKVCFLRFVRYENYLQKLCASNATIAAYKFRMDMYDKWEKRWFKLAKKFKEEA